MPQGRGQGWGKRGGRNRKSSAESGANVSGQFQMHYAMKQLAHFLAFRTKIVKNPYGSSVYLSATT